MATAGLVAPFLAAAALALSLGASPASAQTVTVTASWTVATSCSITGASITGADLSTSSSRTATSTVNCNKGFKITASSANGALKNNTPAPANFTNIIPYTLGISVPVDGGAQPVSASCAASTLTVGQSSCALSPGNASGLSSGGKIATAQSATLSVAWVTPTAPRPIAGAYSDTITLSIATVP